MSDRPRKVPPEIAAKVREELKQLENEAFSMACRHPVAFSVLAAIQQGTKHQSGKQRLFAIEFGRRIQTWLGGPTRPHLSKLLEDGWGAEVDEEGVVLH